MRSVHRLFLLAGLSLSALGASAAEGLKIAPDTDAWPSWQTRLSVVTQPLSGPGSLGSRLQLGAASLSGDHYFSWGRLESGGGLRATSSLLIGPRSLALSAPAAYGPGSLVPLSSSPASQLDAGNDGLVATPYVGLGYSAWWARSGLGLSADLGFIGQQRASQAMRLGSEGGDSQLRAMQMAPILQVNLSYSF
ncbi:MAG TPA: hypothetical protein VLA16_18685 [Ideonella sp.]|nr:hypothetical protein [Ideonella sp.]